MATAMTAVVVGGGLMGLGAAWHLRRAEPGARVTVLERERPGAAASGASAAGVRAMFRDPAERALALTALARWPELDRELEGATGYRRGGGLRVALDAESLALAEAEVAAQRTSGVPVELVDADTVRRLAPGVSPRALGGVWCPIDGQAEAQSTVDAWAAAARRAGARIEAGVEIAALVAEGDRVSGVRRAGGAVDRADVVILAAGAWSADLLAPLGLSLDLEPRPLQMLLTDGAAPALDPVVSAFGVKLSLKQLGDGAFLIGGGWPADLPDARANRAILRQDSVSGSLAAARAAYPPLDGRAVVRRWAGIEAFGAGDLPTIGPVPGVEGLIVATGFSGHGFALVPAVGDVLARLALGREPLSALWSGLAWRAPVHAGHAAAHQSTQSTHA
jgi:sarcosine oxidase subunit beta